MKKLAIGLVVNLIVAAIAVFAVFNVFRIQDDAAICLTFLAISFLHTLAYYKLGRFSQLRQFFKFSIVSILLPYILIDSTTLIDGEELMPLRYPFETSFFVIGWLLGILLIGRKWFFFIPFILAVLSFWMYSKETLIPQMHLKMSSQSQESFQFTYTAKKLLTVDSSLTTLGSYTQKVILVDFFFVGCPPCELKWKSLEHLANQFNSKDFTLIGICDGKITDFASFKSYALSHKKLQLLYDPAGTSDVVPDAGFPMDYLINTKEKRIIKSHQGFNKQMKKPYEKEYEKLIANEIK